VRRMMALVGFSAVTAALCAMAQTASAEGGGLIPPPAISLPYGGKIVTEINLSDNDVLGIIKQIIPAIGELIGSIAPMAAKGPVDAKAMEAIKGIDFRGLSEAISGITNVRVLVAKYGVSLEKPALLKQLDAGVVKLGTFSKVVSDVAMIPGVLALYAQADNGGYVGYAYQSSARTLYAARIVGFADTAKLTKWVMDAIKLATSAVKMPAVPEPKQTPPTPDDSVAPTTAPPAEKQ